MTTESAVQTVRALEVGDLSRLAALAPEFLEEFYGWRTSCNTEQLEAKWARLYASGVGIVFGLFEGDDLVGALGGFLYQDFYDGEWVAADLGWFVKKASRRGLKPLLLLRLFEQWAKCKGAERITFTTILNPKAPGEIQDFRRLGYAPRQVVFGKHL